MRTLTGGARPSLPAPTGPGAVPVHEVGGGKSAAVVGATAGGPEAMPNGLALGNTIPPHAAPPQSPADGIGG